MATNENYICNKLKGTVPIGPIQLEIERLEQQRISNLERFEDHLLKGFINDTDKIQTLEILKDNLLIIKSKISALYFALNGYDAEGLV